RTVCQWNPEVVLFLLVTENNKTLKSKTQSSDLALSSDSVLCGSMSLMRKIRLLCMMRLTFLFFLRLRSRLGSLTSRPGCVTNLSSAHELDPRHVSSKKAPTDCSWSRMIHAKSHWLLSSCSAIPTDGHSWVQGAMRRRSSISRGRRSLIGLSDCIWT